MTHHLDIGESFQQLCSADSPDKLWELADLIAAQHPLFHTGKATENILENKIPIALYGAGRFAEAVIDAWQKRGVSPCYCIDSDSAKWGTLLRNIPVLSPRVLQEYCSTSPLVVIAAMSTHEIEKKLNERNISYLFAERDGSVGFLSGHWLLRHRAEFERIYYAQEDDDSRRVLLEIAKARLFQRYNFPMRGNFFSSEVTTLPQYFVENIISLDNGEVFVDCGAFDGDTLVAFSASMSRLGYHNWQAVAFEVDPDNSKRVACTLKEYKISQAKLVNAAVGERSERVSADRFHNCQGSNKANAEVQVLSLDQALSDLEPTFIKMDIEGGELAALRGARQTILACSPKLAVCIYHSTSDLLEVPLFILENFPNYKMYMRHHSQGTLWETVCYAVPR